MKITNHIYVAGRDPYEVALSRHEEAIHHYGEAVAFDNTLRTAHIMHMNHHIQNDRVCYAILVLGVVLYIYSILRPWSIINNW